MFCLSLLLLPFFEKPKSRKHHQIIESTAKQVAKDPQMEIRLRVTEKDNPNFAFLLVGDELYNYYEYLVQMSKKEINAARQSSGISLLDTAYYDESENESENENEDANEKGVNELGKVVNTIEQDVKEVRVVDFRQHNFSC